MGAIILTIFIIYLILAVPVTRFFVLKLTELMFNTLAWFTSTITGWFIIGIIYAISRS